MLTRDEMLEANDHQIVKVAVPEWGGHVHVCTITGRQRDAWEQQMVGDRKAGKAQMANIRASLAVLTVCDEKGDPVFRPGDVDTLGEKSAAALDRIFEVASKINHLGEKDVEELAGNSGGAPSADSGSD